MTASQGFVQKRTQT